MPDKAQNDQPINPFLLDQLWDADDPAGTEQRLRDEIAQREPSSLQAMELTTQLARALGGQGRFDEADALLDGVKGGHPIALTRIKLERGRLHHAEGDPQQAMMAFASAVGHAVMIGYGDLALEAIHMLTIVDEDNAPAWARQGLEIVAASPDPRMQRWREVLQQSLGER